MSKWFYQAGISFNTMKCNAFKVAWEPLSRLGLNHKPLSYNEVSDTCLKTEVDETTNLIYKYKSDWLIYGCILMNDVWMNVNGNSIHNFLINCPTGTMFFKSVDVSKEKQTHSYLLKEIEQTI